MRRSVRDYKEACEIDEMIEKLKENKDFQKWSAENLLNKSDSNDIETFYYKFC